MMHLHSDLGHRADKNALRWDSFLAISLSSSVNSPGHTGRIGGQIWFVYVIFYVFNGGVVDSVCFFWGRPLFNISCLNVRETS